MKIIAFIFAGRQANMEVQMPYLHRLLDTYPEMELHLWDLTRAPSDAGYLRRLHGGHDGRIKMIHDLHPGHPIRCLYPNGKAQRRGWPKCRCLLHKPPYERPYQMYAAQEKYADAIYVKMDDDVLFLETDRFDDLIAPLVKHPNRVISANVINNAVCAKYEPEFVGMFDGLFNPRNPRYDKAWWALHTSPEFALLSHDWFINDWATQAHQVTPIRPSYIRTRPGEAISINCIAFTHATMKRMATAFRTDSRLGDEGVVDSYLPWIARSFHAAHLTFGPQDAALTKVQLDGLRTQYAMLSGEYLDDSWKGELV